MKQNLLLSILKMLDVKQTNTFTTRYFNEHPHKYNLFGLSSMPSGCGIENAGIKILDKNEIHSNDVPFISLAGNDFVIVLKIIGDKIEFIEREKRIKIPSDEFLEMWTGYTLIVEPNVISKEPDDEIHFRNDIFHKLREIVILSILVFLFAFALISKMDYLQSGVTLLMAINMVGKYISYLLVLIQLHIQSNYAYKLYSLFKYNGCNNILEDVFRYLILYKMGGMYVDFDYECLESFDNHVEGDRKCYFAMEPEDHCTNFFERETFNNALMATCPGHHFFEKIISHIFFDSTYIYTDNKVRDVHATTGPVMLTGLYDGYPDKSDIILWPEELVSPWSKIDVRKVMGKAADENIMNRKLEKAIAIHYFFSLWA